ncbi:MAG: alpha/beta hydrolase [Clostridia bacterium]|nr:alpha/beta hydrolase [Clostridia bacterium]
MKKVMKIIGIVLLCIVVLVVVLIVVNMIKTAINNKRVWIPDNYYTAFESDSALEKKYAGLGEYEVKELEFDSENKAIDKIRVWYPNEAENRQYPVIVIVNASNTAALNLKPAYARLASWGFIVVGNDDRQTGTGKTASETLDYVLNLNKDKNSELFGKINEEHIGCVGYSQGGAGAINAVTKFENSDKFTALFTGSASYALLSQNMGWGYDVSQINIPYFMTAGTGNTDDNGGSIHDDKNLAGIAPLASLVENYDGITADVFKLRARVTGAEHQDMLHLTDGYMTAWMLYHLQGDTEAASVFVGENADILTNNGWQDVEKNK